MQKSIHTKHTWRNNDRRPPTQASTTDTRTTKDPFKKPPTYSPAGVCLSRPRHDHRQHGAVRRAFLLNVIHDVLESKKKSKKRERDRAAVSWVERRRNKQTRTTQNQAPVVSRRAWRRNKAAVCCFALWQGRWMNDVKSKVNSSVDGPASTATHFVLTVQST